LGLFSRKLAAVLKMELRQLTFSGLKTGFFFLLLMTAAILPAKAEDDAWYLRLQGGANFAADQDITGIKGTVFQRQGDFGTGYAAGAALGRSFGPLRLEGEFLARENDVDRLTGGPGLVSGDRSVRSVTANLLYDFYSLPLSSGRTLDLHLGAGLGAARVSLDGVTEGGAALLDDDDSVFAYQGILGASVALNERLSLNLDYRYMATADPEFRTAAGGNVESEVGDHALLFGLTWHFGPGPKAAAPARTAEAPSPARTAPSTTTRPAVSKKAFLVFFDWNQAVIRTDAAEILRGAAVAAKQGNLAVIQLTGHADRSGPRPYNQGLSERRAGAVKRFLIDQGVPEDIIATLGKGEDDPLVATPDNAREPRNRRVEIVLP